MSSLHIEYSGFVFNIVQGVALTRDEKRFLHSQSAVCALHLRLSRRWEGLWFRGTDVVYVQDSLGRFDHEFFTELCDRMSEVLVDLSVRGDTDFKLVLFLVSTEFGRNIWVVRMERDESMSRDVKVGLGLYRAYNGSRWVSLFDGVFVMYMGYVSARESGVVRGHQQFGADAQRSGEESIVSSSWEIARGGYECWIMSVNLEVVEVLSGWESTHAFMMDYRLDREHTRKRMTLLHKLVRHSQERYRANECVDDIAWRDSTEQYDTLGILVWESGRLDSGSHTDTLEWVLWDHAIYPGIWDESDTGTTREFTHTGREDGGGGVQNVGFNEVMSFSSYPDDRLVGVVRILGCDDDETRDIDMLGVWVFGRGGCGLRDWKDFDRRLDVDSRVKERMDGDLILHATQLSLMISVRVRGDSRLLRWSGSHSGDIWYLHRTQQIVNTRLHDSEHGLGCGQLNTVFMMWIFRIVVWGGGWASVENRGREYMVGHDGATLVTSTMIFCRDSKVMNIDYGLYSLGVYKCRKSTERIRDLRSDSGDLVNLSIRRITDNDTWRGYGSTHDFFSYYTKSQQVREGLTMDTEWSHTGLGATRAVDGEGSRLVENSVRSMKQDWVLVGRGGFRRGVFGWEWRLIGVVVGGWRMFALYYAVESHGYDNVIMREQLDELSTQGEVESGRSVYGGEGGDDYDLMITHFSRSFSVEEWCESRRESTRCTQRNSVSNVRSHDQERREAISLRCTLSLEYMRYGLLVSSQFRSMVRCMTSRRRSVALCGGQWDTVWMCEGGTRVALGCGLRFITLVLAHTIWGDSLLGVVDYEGHQCGEEGGGGYGNVRLGLEVGMVGGGDCFLGCVERVEGVWVGWGGEGFEGEFGVWGYGRWRGVVVGMGGWGGVEIGVGLGGDGGYRGRGGRGCGEVDWG
ncbi:hypothetical protein Tco_0012445 [Tanacetum coccineum]